MVRTGKYIYLATILVGLVLPVSIVYAEVASKPAKPQVPRYVVDPFWPKSLPDGWVTGEVAGTCVDSKDHLFVVTRGFQTKGLERSEGVAGDPKSKAAPPVIEFDPEGNVVNSWGNTAIVTSGPNAGKNEVLPHGMHSCFIDFENNVWIAGNEDGIVQKYSHDGKKLLLQIGSKFLCDRPDLGGSGPCDFRIKAGNTNGSSQTLLNCPADIAVDPNPDPVTGKRGNVYIADGYGNHRVVVFDSTGKFVRQMGGMGTGPGEFTPGGGGHPHCVVLANDGLVYTCDRGDDRLNVFKKDGTFMRAISVIPGTGNAKPNFLGTGGSAFDIDFSRDKNQKYMYVSDGGNEVIWIFDHKTDKILGGLGRPGHMSGDFTTLHTLAVDSKGRIYAGETINGRRLQRLVPHGMVPNSKLEMIPLPGDGVIRPHYDDRK